VDVKIQVPGATLLHPAEDVVSTGSIVIFNNNTITFLLSENNNNVYKFEVEIFDAPEGGPASLNTVPTMGSSALNALTGFAGPMGSRLILKNFGFQPLLTTTSKVPVTAIDGKQIYLTFVVQSVGTARIFHYTLSR
jgi:hypothetical protein